ncbi:MAG: hypothetical protein ACXWQE_09405 [Bdellovibrionales bacterium]
MKFITQMAVLTICCFGYLTEANAAERLSCPEFFNIVIDGVEANTKKVNVINYIGPTFEIPLTTDGDCTGRARRGYLCFQEGQFMLNIPKSLASGKVTTGWVWIQGDTDDNDGSIGQRYKCSVE